MADFIQDDEACKNVTFKRSLFDPIWQRLKDQGGGSGSGSGGTDGHSPPSKKSKGKDKGKRKSPSNSNKRKSISWKCQKISNPLSTKAWGFVPPKSSSNLLGTTTTTTNRSIKASAKLGRDYYISEEHVIQSILEDISTLEESNICELYAQNIQYFTTIVPILDKAVNEGVEYNFAAHPRDGDLATTTTNNKVKVEEGGVANDATSGSRKQRSTRGTRSCNLHSFGVDCALMADPYELSGSSEENSIELIEDEVGGDDDGNEDECAICEDGGGKFVCVLD